jgi:hypothetical protein
VFVVALLSARMTIINADKAAAGTFAQIVLTSIVLCKDILRISC